MILYSYDRYEQAEGKALLMAALLDYCGKNGIKAGPSGEAIELTTGLHGKPCCVRPAGVHFSISHSRGSWLCGVADRPIGIDIETTAPWNDAFGRTEADRCNRIAQRFFTAAERQYVRAHGRQGFLAIWVRKEAFVKYKGTGFSEGFQRFSAVEGDRLSDTIEGAEITTIDLGPGWIGACCGSGIGPVSEMIRLEDIHGR